MHKREALVLSTHPLRLDDAQTRHQTPRVHMLNSGFAYFSRRVSLRAALALALLLGWWCLAFAFHVHADDDYGFPHQGAHCTFCVSLPVAGPAPSVFELPEAKGTFAPPLALESATLAVAISHSYQSRAPPAS